MKIAVLGAGAMGSLYGGNLSESGAEVTLIDIWEEHVNNINQNGLIIEDVNGKQRTIKNVKAVKSASEVEVVDLVIVFVKATMTGQAMEKAKNLIGPKTMVLTLQNGLGNVEQLENVVDKKHIIAGVTGCGASIIGPGHIRHAGQGDTVLGELDGTETERILNLKNVFEKANFPAKISKNILGLVWTKLIGNIGINALCALTKIKNGQVVEILEAEAILEAAILEALEVAKAQNIIIEADNPINYVKELARKTAGNRCSMLQDVDAKRVTEIAVINGAIVEFGKKYNIPTPVNMVLTNLIKTIQNTY